MWNHTASVFLCLTYSFSIVPSKSIHVVANGKIFSFLWLNNIPPPFFPFFCGTPGFPVRHQLPELAQTHVLACCSPWGCKESDMTELLNWTEYSIVYIVGLLYPWVPYLWIWKPTVPCHVIWGTWPNMMWYTQESWNHPPGKPKDNYIYHDFIIHPSIDTLAISVRSL